MRASYQMCQMVIRHVFIPLLINQVCFRAILDIALVFWQFHLVLVRIGASFIENVLSPRAPAFSVDFFAHNVIAANSAYNSKIISPSKPLG